MRIHNGVEMLEIPSNIMGVKSVIHPVLIWDGQTMTLVDAGYPGQLPIIRDAAENAGAPFDKLNTIIITHHDMDHIGGLAGILSEMPGKIKVFAHEDEKPYITGEKTPVKIAQLEAKLDSLNDEMKAFYNRLKSGFDYCRANVDRTVVDGAELPYCGGIVVIGTPGHTPGHICLYLNKSKTLITGDALNIIDGRLTGPNPKYTLDMDQAVKSLRKLTEYDIQNLICYHGGLYKGEANQRIRELIGA